MKRKLAWLLALAAFALVVAGCNTDRGLRQGHEGHRPAVEKAAAKTKTY